MIKRYILQKLENIGFVTDKSLKYVNVSFMGKDFGSSLHSWEYIKTLRKCGFTVKTVSLTLLDQYLLTGRKL